MGEAHAYVQEIAAVFSAIARKIEELLVLLNETHASGGQVEEVADRINMFLGGLKRSVQREKGLARSLTPVRKKEFLASLRRELTDIKQLQSYVALSKRRATPTIIRKIDELYKVIEMEMRVQVQTTTSS